MEKVNKMRVDTSSNENDNNILFMYIGWLLMAIRQFKINNKYIKMYIMFKNCNRKL